MVIPGNGRKGGDIVEQLTRNIYGIVLISLLFELVASPLIVAAGGDGNLVEVLLFASLAAAALGASTANQRRWLLVILVGAAVARLVGRFQNIEAASAAATAVWILVAIIAALRALRFALFSGEIDREHLCAALSVYMLAGHFFGLAYWRLDHLAPGSFATTGAGLSAGPLDLSSAIYFSFVVISTVGFGDIVPATAVSRGLVVTEAVAGQFYLVVVVARLVSLYSQRSPSKTERPNDDSSLRDPRTER